MVYRECDDCHLKYEFWSDDDVPTRGAELEDGLRPYDRVECCPDCGGYLFEISEEEYLEYENE